MNDGDKYDAEYFLCGKKAGKSLYNDYHWMPELTIPMVRMIIEVLGIRKGDKVLDFGCARGYVVRAFRELGYDAHGMDASQWAVENCDKAVVGFVRQGLYTNERYDWIIAKDVLEHVTALKLAVAQLQRARKGLFVVVPLSAADDAPYVIPDYEKDVTHLHRLTLGTWVNMFLEPAWHVTVAYRFPMVKQNWYKPGWEAGNGFIVARRN